MKKAVIADKGTNVTDFIYTFKVPMQKLLRFEFLPVNPALGLLALRVVMGGSMLWLHGWGKVIKLVHGQSGMPDVIGIGPMPTLLLAVFAEVVCSVLIVVGAFTRLAACFIGATMSVAFFIVNSGRLTGPSNGELPFLYLTGCLVLLLAGAGKYSLDKK